MNYCKCHQPLNFKEALAGLKDEAIEFVEEPSADEASDIAYSINRLVGGLFNKAYIRVLPTGGIHERKIQLRMDEHGCIRSKRHLVDGRCPSE